MGNCSSVGHDVRFERVVMVRDSVLGCFFKEATPVVAPLAEEETFIVGMVVLIETGSENFQWNC